jgi:hypothetical protein
MPENLKQANNLDNFIRQARQYFCASLTVNFHKAGRIFNIYTFNEIKVLP